MKILFINPPIREWAKPNMIPMGIAILASVLRNAGHKVEVLDINGCRFSPSQVEEKIKKADYDLVGIGCIVTAYRYVKWLVKILRKAHPDKKIIVGGSVGTSIPHVILEKNDVDLVCIGEGEVTILEILNALAENKDLSGVDGIWYKDKNGEIHQNKSRAPIMNLDVLPFPAWDLFPMEIYAKNPVGAINKNKWVDGNGNEDTLLSINVYGSRGCPYKCIYCYHDFMGVRWRYRSPNLIIKEMKYLYDKYQIRYFHITDDLFCVNKKFVYEFCEKFKKEFNGNAIWATCGRVNIMTDELVATMKDGGCIEINYGIESGSQKMLNTMKKQVTVEQAKCSVRLAQKYFGYADTSFIVGLPGETRETIQETVDFCKELNLVPQVIFFATAYPGTELYQMALSQGRIKDEDAYLLDLGEQGEKIRINFTDFSDDELYKIKAEMVEELGAWNKINHQKVSSLEV